MISIDKAFTVVSGGSKIYNLKITAPIKFNPKTDLEIDYRYINGMGFGKIRCTFKKGFYQGWYEETITENNGEKIKYKGDVWYLVTEAHDKLYIHGEWNVWKYLPNRRGYDFYIVNQ